MFRRTHAVLWIVIASLLLVLCTLAGCPKAAPPATSALPTPAPPATTPPPEAATPVATPPAATPAAPDKPAPAETTAPVPTSYKWTESPTLAGIPSGPVVGVINGKGFAAKAVRMKKDKGEVVLEFSGKAPSNPSGPLMENTAVQLTLRSVTEGKPLDFVRALVKPKDSSKEHAYYHYPSSGGPVSVNSEYAVALRISSWTLKTDATNPDLRGTMKGKVAICFGDDAKSWVAGNFEGVYFEW